MARRRVAVQVEAAGGLQHPVQFDQPDRHHGQIGHHVVFAQKAPHRPQHLGRRPVARPQHILKRRLGAVVPVPGVVEGLDLGGALIALRPLEKDVVGGVRIERRVEIDQVDALVPDAVAQHLEVVAIVKVVAHPPVPCPLPVCDILDCGHHNVFAVPDKPKRPVPPPRPCS